MEYSSRESDLLVKTVEVLNEIQRDCQSIPGLSYPVAKLSGELCSFLSDLKHREEKDLSEGNGPVKKALLERNRLLEAYNRSFPQGFYSQAADAEINLNRGLIFDLSPEIITGEDVFNEHKFSQYLGQYFNYINSKTIHINDKPASIVKLTKNFIDNQPKNDEDIGKDPNQIVIYKEFKNCVVVKYNETKNSSYDFFDMNFIITETSGCVKSFTIRFTDNESIFYISDFKVYSVLEDKEFPGANYHISMKFVQKVMDIFLSKIISGDKLDSTIVSKGTVESRLRQFFKEKFFDTPSPEERNKYFNKDVKQYSKYGHSKINLSKYNKDEISFTLDEEGLLISLWYRLYYHDFKTKQLSTHNSIEIIYDQRTGWMIKRSSETEITQTTLNYILECLSKENFEY